MSFKRLRFEIDNPIAGAGTPGYARGHGIGMTNIRQRLALAYDERASLKTWTHSGIYHAALTLPPVAAICAGCYCSNLSHK